MSSSQKLAEQKTAFIDKINKRDCVIGVIGLGYVGIPLALGFNECGFAVMGYDIKVEGVEAINEGRSLIAHISNERIKKMRATGRFEATTDFSRLKEADALLICVPTPLSKTREPDLSYVEATTRTIAEHLRPGQMVVLESTTYPGTTREIMQPILEEISGLKVDEDFILAYSPEREDPGNPDFNTATIPKVVGAATPEGLDMVAALYEPLVTDVVRVSSLEAAEAVKLTENVFRAVNIALVNELKLIYDDMGIDVWEVIDAAATKPFGFMPFYPGPGLGGHCIPIDPFYLAWKAREFGRHTRFIELAGEINTNMPEHVIAKLAEALSKQQKKAMNGARVLVVGIAYKKNVDDMRESPSLVLMEMLKEQGAEFEYYDPHIPEVPMTREHSNLAGLKSLDWSAAALAKFDAALIATDHDKVDWQELVENVPLTIDTRNATQGLSDKLREKIVKA
jgi:UDP-N-acetyl-D-glucosamine dehydrogenase